MYVLIKVAPFVRVECSLCGNIWDEGHTWGKKHLAKIAESMRCLGGETKGTQLVQPQHARCIAGLAVAGADAAAGWGNPLPTTPLVESLPSSDQSGQQCVSRDEGAVAVPERLFLVKQMDLGLGLHIGAVYPEKELRRRCGDEEVKLATLELFLREPAYFAEVRPERQQEEIMHVKDPPAALEPWSQSRKICHQDSPKAQFNYNIPVPEHLKEKLLAHIPSGEKVYARLHPNGFQALCGLCGNVWDIGHTMSKRHTTRMRNPMHYPGFWSNSIEGPKSFQ